MAHERPVEKSHQAVFATQVHRGLLGVAVISVGCALLRAIYPAVQIDQTTALFLGIAMLSLVIHQVTEFSGFGIVVKKTIDQLQEDVNAVEVAVGSLEKEVGPGSKAASLRAGPLPAQQSRSVLAIDPADPNKNQFGGKAQANGRELTALIRPIAGPKSSRCSVRIRVASTDPANPLMGKVMFYLHPTFGDWSSYEVDVENGVAEDEIVSYGAFTIGAVADEGQTRLELDLMHVPGGTKQFYEL